MLDLTAGQPDDPAAIGLPVVGFALVEAKSREEAIEFSRRFWQVAGDGGGEIYEVFGG